MIKKRLFVTIIGLLLVFGLFMMPMVVVENENKKSDLQEEEAADEATATGGGGAISPGGQSAVPGSAQNHETSLSADQKKRISELQEALNNSNNKKNSIKFADSLATIYESANKFDSAAYYAGKTAELNPSSENLWRAGNFYYNAFNLSSQGDNNNATQTSRYGKQARNYFERLRKKDPDHLEAKVKIAMTYVSSSTPMKGIQMLREVLEEDENNESALFNLGLLSIRTGQTEKALNRFEKLVEVNPDNIQGQFYLGVCYQEMGQTEKAKKQFDQVKAMSDNPMIEKSVDNYLKNI